MKRGHRTDDRVATAPLRALLRDERIGHLCCNGHNGDEMRQGRRGIALDLAERYGVSERQASRWLMTVDRNETVNIYIADAICCLLNVPMGYIYSGVAS